VQYTTMLSWDNSTARSIKNNHKTSNAFDEMIGQLIRQAELNLSLQKY
jgi:hypothetical protein